MIRRPDIDKNEKDHVYYSEFWSRNPKYGEILPYMRPMLEIIKATCEPKHVLEVGFGFGHMIAMVVDEIRPKTYTGYEFSDSFDYAEVMLQGVNNEDCTIDLINYTFRYSADLNKYDCVIAQEIFEHIIWDLEFVKEIEAGTWVFFSVPNKPAKCHVRHFGNKDEIHDRYDGLLDISDIRFLNNKHWIVTSKRRSDG